MESEKNHIYLYYGYCVYCVQSAAKHTTIFFFFFRHSCQCTLAYDWFTVNTSGSQRHCVT